MIRIYVSLTYLIIFMNILLNVCYSFVFLLYVKYVKQFFSLYDQIEYKRLILFKIFKIIFCIHAKNIAANKSCSDNCNFEKPEHQIIADS